MTAAIRQILTFAFATLAVVISLFVAWRLIGITIWASACIVDEWGLPGVFELIAVILVSAAVAAAIIGGVVFGISRVAGLLKRQHRHPTTR